MPESEINLSLPEVVPLHGPVDENAAQLVITLILFQMKQFDEVIWLDIDSGGGDVNSALAIVEVVLEHRERIATRCSGMACGNALLVLAAGKPGFRCARPGAVLNFGHIFGGQSSSTNEDVARHHANLFSQLTRMDANSAFEHVRLGSAIQPETALELGIVDLIDHEPA